jgi:type II secretory pathway pseudopilin PulG
MKTARSGYCLAELLVVLLLVGISLTIGATCIWRGLDRQQARGTAQSAQAAVAWAQLGVVWQGGEAEVSLGRSDIAVSHSLGRCGGNLGSLGPSSLVTANVSRWNTLGGVALRILGHFASPDSGGSLYVDGGDGAYRVVIRPESGLTARSWGAR